MKRDCSFRKRRAYKERNVFSHSTDTPAWASSMSPTAPQVYGFPELVATSVLDNIVSEFRLLFQAISGGANRDAIDAVASAKPSLSLSLLAAFLRTDGEDRSLRQMNISRSEGRGTFAFAQFTLLSMSA